MRDREDGEFTDEALKERLDALHDDGSGNVDMSSSCPHCKISKLNTGM
jgi:hypothetical protein